MRNKVDKVNQKPPSPALEVLERVHDIMHLYRSAQQRSLRAGPHDLAHMEIKVLGFFARRPGATQSDLAAHSGRDKAQLARLVRGLRDRGLLKAVTDEADKRSTRLSLSDEGKAMFAALHVHDGALAEAALDGIPDADRATLLDLLARVHANLEAGQG
ncbi:MarR family transcriptional regulator [Massilia sp. TW-1]|uniref:MarR family transcriptional regulator n=1 Tax=Telluria antibiotica TaxID=2717319 RepID=A0ABX0P9I8_9BURK|nr:MarR family transcriptional regulator [Telluria antibiotica]NIA52855.1 MarR family transcriptional regulator [Telluria antibiotica]